MKLKRTLLLLTATSIIAVAQSSQELVSQGDAAAHQDRHRDAIAAYEKALVQEPGLRSDLLAKLGRQYLWSDQSQKAAELLGEYIANHSDACDVRMDYALALSWTNRLRESKQAYETVRTTCPEQKTSALLAEARVLRWMGKSEAADRLYKQALVSAPKEEAEQARIGIGLDQLSRDENRAARKTFMGLLQDGCKAPDAAEGAILANWRLGRNDEAHSILDTTQAQQPGNARMGQIRQEMRDSAGFVLSPTASAFHDSDGTMFYASQFTVISRSAIGHFEESIGGSRLEGTTSSVVSNWVSSSLEHRFNPSLAIRGEGRVSDYHKLNFEPVTGELDAVITPTDSTRVDLAGARIAISDNIAALQHHLLGTFASAGIDQKWNSHWATTTAYDTTLWTEGNRRTRYRVSPSYRFEGSRKITIALPVLYQSYDEGFHFGLFSPRSYIEAGPSLSMAVFHTRRWELDFIGRAGAQKEAALAWKPLGQVSLLADRQLSTHWGVRGGFAFSSSNITSASGFNRTSGTFSLYRRF